MMQVVDIRFPASLVVSVSRLSVDQLSKASRPPHIKAETNTHIKSRSRERSDLGLPKKVVDISSCLVRNGSDHTFVPTD